MTRIETQDFVRRFFSAPNLAWPNADPGSATASTLEPFLRPLSQQGECPVILPRRDSAGDAPSLVYVVCWDTSHAGRVRSLLESAVAHHWCHFDGRVARLDPTDPVDGAVLDLVGPGTTFVLRPTKQTAQATFRALGRLVATIDYAPLRQSRTPRPIGRMLREFDLALAAGAVDSSSRLLKEIESFGGISHENVAFLQVRRLAQLGRDDDLLAHGSLPTLVYAEPPRLVREGVLAAWARLHIKDFLQQGDVDSAIAALETAKPDVAMLVDASIANSTDADAVAICALAALSRGDHELAESLATNPAVDSALLGRLELMPGADAAGREALDAPVGDEASLDRGVAEEDEESAPKSWLEWVRQLAQHAIEPLDASRALEWAPAWMCDQELAEAISGLPEIATDDLLSGVAAFLDTEEFDRPASASAAALIRRYLIAERFNPYDLGAVCSLLGSFLRSGPSAVEYSDVLGDIRAFAPQWVSIATASRAIDLADAVACGPVGDGAARMDFVATLLSPLNQQRHRMPRSLLQLARLVTDDVTLDYDWTVAESDVEESADSPRIEHRILLYSLDSGTLDRVRTVIAQRWPDARVYVSDDKDGNPTLRQHARNADLIVMATRRATHAATGFIGNNAAGAVIRYPDGSGSASMLRAVEDGVADLVG